MESLAKHKASIIAGGGAAVGSLLGKVAANADSAPARARELCAALALANDQCVATTSVVLRVLSFVVMILVNSFMISMTIHGMRESGSVGFTVVFTGTNIITTALVGALLFNEELSLLWWLGGLITFAGVVLVSMGEAENRPRPQEPSPPPAPAPPSASSAEDEDPAPVVATSPSPTPPSAVRQRPPTAAARRRSESPAGRQR